MMETSLHYLLFSSLLLCCKTNEENPNTTSYPADPQPPHVHIGYLLLSLIWITIIFLLLLLVLLVRRSIYKKSESEEREAGEDSITYSDVRVTQHHRKNKQLSKEGDPAAVYSAVRTEDIHYGEIVIKNKEQKSKEFSPEPDVVYSPMK